MAVQLADAEPVAAENPVDRHKVRDPVPRPPAMYDHIPPEDDSPANPTKGILIAALISAPIWALAVVAIYRLM